jgi:hypothetical protein
MPRNGKLSAADVADLPDKAGGYCGTGMSKFSRIVAHREPTPRMASRPTRIHGRSHTLPELIEETRARIRHTQAELRITDDSDRRRKLAEKLEIKLTFLARLKEEKEKDAGDGN